MFFYFYFILFFQLLLFKIAQTYFSTLVNIVLSVSSSTLPSTLLRNPPPSILSFITHSYLFTYQHNPLENLSVSILLLSHLNLNKLIHNHFSSFQKPSPKHYENPLTNPYLLLAPSMAPPKRSKGKGKIDESSNALNSDPEQFQPSLKQRRMMTSLRQRNVLLPKFGKIDTFPSSSFQFPVILEYQGVVNFLSDSRLFYQDLVREFYTHFTILPGCACPWKMLMLVLVFHLKAKEFRMDLLLTLRVGKISTT